jgi:hypothetical protein
MKDIERGLKVKTVQDISGKGEQNIKHAEKR